MRRSLIAGMVGLSSVLACTQAMGSGEQDRAFTVSSNPDTVVVQLDSFDYRHGSRRLRLFGDGKLVHESLEISPPRSPLATAQLTSGEVERVVRIAVEAGLIECGTECIGRKVMDCLDLNRVPTAIDGDEKSLTINLESYRQAGASASAPKEVIITLQTPGMLARYCPGLPELDGFFDLQRSLGQKLRQGEEDAQ